MLRHYELTALEAADGYADRLASFEKDIIMIIQERMIVTSDAQNARINGYVYYPAMPAFWRMPAGNLWFAIAMGLIFARLADNPAFGFAMFALFICGGREEKPRKVIGDGGESGDDAGTSGQ